MITEQESKIIVDEWYKSAKVGDKVKFKLPFIRGMPKDVEYLIVNIAHHRKCQTGTSIEVDGYPGNYLDADWFCPVKEIYKDNRDKL